LLLTWLRKRSSGGGVRVNSEITEFEDLINGIKEGKFDGSSALWFTAEREEFLIYSVPYLQNQLILVGPKGSDVSVASFSELGGKRVAVVENYAYGDSVYKANGVLLVPGRSDQENLERLIKDEADYMLVDALLIQYLLAYQGAEVRKYLEVGSTPILNRSLHFAVGKDLSGGEAIIKRFNEDILKMMVDGTYNRILKLNWIRADVDGDGKLELVLAGNQAGRAAPGGGYNIYFEDSSPAPDASGNRYYIDGNFYQGWDKVPKEYKVPNQKGGMNRMELLEFSF